MNTWTADFERVTRLGLFAWIAYAITRTALGLIDFAGRFAIIGVAGYLAIEYARSFH